MRVSSFRKHLGDMQIVTLEHTPIELGAVFSFRRDVHDRHQRDGWIWWFCERQNSIITGLPMPPDLPGVRLLDDPEESEMDINAWAVANLDLVIPKIERAGF